MTCLCHSSDSLSFPGKRGYSKPLKHLFLFSGCPHQKGSAGRSSTSSSMCFSIPLGAHPASDLADLPESLSNCRLHTSSRIPPLPPPRAITSPEHTLQVPSPGQTARPPINPSVRLRKVLDGFFKVLGLARNRFGRPGRLLIRSSGSSTGRRRVVDGSAGADVDLGMIDLEAIGMKPQTERCRQKEYPKRRYQSLL